MSNPYFSLISKIWNYGAPWRRAIVGYYLSFIIARIIRNLSPFALGKTIDVLQNFKPERLSEVIYWLVFGIVVILLFWLFHGPTRVIERKIALKIEQHFELNIYQQLTKLPLKWHQMNHSGNVVTRLNRASLALYNFSEDQFVYIESIVTFFTSIGFLCWISLPIGLLSLLMTAVMVLLIIFFDKKLIHLYAKQNEIENKVGAVLFDYLNNITTVLTLRLEKLTHTNLGQRMQSIWPAFKKEIVLNEIKWFTVEMVLSISQTMILIGYILYYLKGTGSIMIGTVVMIFRYQWELTTVFHELSFHYSQLVHMETDVKGIEPLLTDIKNYLGNPNELIVNNHWKTIHIQSLNFSHNQSVESLPIFKNIELLIRRGEKIALIGLSGGGKSTLLNLLGGLYEPSKVSLQIGEQKFNSLLPLRSIATLIPQDPEIFENTILFNITMGLPIAKEELEEIIFLSGFQPVLDKLPAGLETYIQEKGLNFSVGQKQRLALARGLFSAHFSSIILMDEPTSSIDLKTEKEILTNVIKAFSTTTMLITLHRLHLLPIFDRIIMLGKTGIIADGSSKVLLSEPGPVQNLWKSYQAYEFNNL